YQTFCAIEALSLTDELNPFDEQADGYLPGEGVAVLLIKPLTHAMKAGDSVHGIIKGSHVNSGGHSAGPTIPNVDQEEAVIVKAWEASGIDPETISYFEAHGTGTKLGDPLEVNAIKRAFGRFTDKQQFCALGTVKANIGHTEATAGLAGVIKVLLQMRHDCLPGLPKLQTLNKMIVLADSPLYIPRESQVWPRQGNHPHRAVVSSFGMGGTYAHVVLEATPDSYLHSQQIKAQSARIKPYYLIALSAKTQASLKRSITHLHTWLCEKTAQWTVEQANRIILPSLSYTLNACRAHFNYRCTLVVSSLAHLQDSLEKFEGSDTGVLPSTLTHVFMGDACNTPDDAAIYKQVLATSVEKLQQFSADADVQQYQDTLLALANLYSKGYVLDWALLHRDEACQKIALPAYAFAKERYWVATTPAVIATDPTALHPLLTCNVSTLNAPCFTKRLTGQEFYLTDHVIQGHKMLPGVAYLEMARVAGNVAHLTQTVFQLCDVTWMHPCIVEQDPVQLSVALTPTAAEADAVTFAISSAGERVDTTGGATSIVHAQGTLVYGAHTAQSLPSRLEVVNARKALSETLSGDRLYAQLATLGYDYGQSFQCLQWLQYDSEQGKGVGYVVLSEVLRQAADRHDYGLHPALVDSCLHAVLGMAMGPSHAPADAAALLVPFSVDVVSVYGALTDACYVLVDLTHHAVDEISAHVQITDETGQVLVDLQKVSARLLTTVNKVAPLATPDSLPAPAVKPRSGADATLCYYVPQWQAQDLPTNPSNQDAINGLLILTNQQRDVEQLQAQLSTTQIPLIQVSAGKDYKKLKHDHYQVRLSVADDYRRLWHDLLKDNRTISHVLHVWDVYHKGSSKLSTVLAYALESVWLLTQASIVAKISALRLLSICSNDREDIHQVVDTALIGLCRSIRQEQPRYCYSLLQVDTRNWGVNPASHLFEHAIAELTVQADAAEHVSYKDNKRHVLRFILAKDVPVSAISHSRLPTTTSLSLASGDVIVLTGGLGGLGYLFAQYVAQQYHAKLVLTGRSALDTAKQAKLVQLEQLGADVLYIPCDISDRNGVEQLIAKAKAHFTRIDGVIHCAGVLHDSLLSHKTQQEFAAVLAPKISGTVHLDTVLKHEPLKYFVLFSSLASVLGNVGQADYASANAFMDSFAQWRQHQREQGQRQGKTLSISWPLWREGGMQLDEATQTWLADTLGMQPLPTAQGLHAFETVLAMGDSDAVSPAAFSHVVVGYGDATVIQRVLTTTPTIDAANASEQAKLPIAASLESARELTEAMQQYLMRLLRDVLKLKPQKIGLDTPFERYGLDSVLVVQLTRVLEKDFGALPKTLFFEYQTLSALTTYFVTQHTQPLQQYFSNGAAQREASAVAVKKNRPAAALSLPSLRAISSPVASLVTERPVTPTSEHPQPRHHTPNTAVEPIAIIGLAGYYPQAKNLDEFWKNLTEGKDSIVEIPADHWNHRDYFSQDKNQTGKSYSKWGSFVDDFDKFDPLFFNISPREAELMDPQERLFLEVSWHCLEDAGYTADSLGNGYAASSVGTFVGVMYGSYQLYTSSASAGLPSSSYASIANRVSSYLNLHGPSMAIDTMCSSSLTSIHLACEAIQHGHCHMALAGGVNISSHPSKYQFLSQGKFLSSEGHCKSFGEGGDGYVPGEGVGAVLLKPLSKAIADNDHIYGVIKGSSINHGGKANGYTVPNPVAQGEVIVEACKRANITPDSLSYIECHGTGTSLGDPIEIRGLSRAFGETQRAPTDKKLAIGSVKSNMGHLESAAGIVALTKVLLQLQHKQLVPSIHAETLNPHIDFAQTPFVVQRELSEWPSIGDEPRRAGISSFGAGGSNAHMIIEEYVPSAVVKTAVVKPYYLIALSAKIPSSLTQKMVELSAWLVQQKKLSLKDENKAVSLASISYTLNACRSHFDYRCALVVSSLDELQQRLESLATHTSRQHSNVFFGDATH
ncbi:MAG: SDR family NAD(P)-dependent oxidoreductase, partial [Cycloclasticus sp.]|nr:SDR family NAD(P)-dependent oxidoreductase [Cycloclasticus sp.]